MVSPVSLGRTELPAVSPQSGAWGATALTACGCPVGPQGRAAGERRAGLRVAPFLGNGHVEHSLFRISFPVLVLVWPWLACQRGAVCVESRRGPPVLGLRLE